MDRAFRLPLKHDTLQNKVESGIPLVVTYNPAFRNLSTTLRKNFNILCSDAEIRKIFTPSPFVAYRSARIFKSVLVRSKVYPLERTVGSSNVVPKDVRFALMFQKQIFLNPFRQETI